MQGRFTIPHHGQVFELSEDWEFSLFNCLRNHTLMQHLGDIRNWETAWSRKFARTVFLPAGTVLVVNAFTMSSSSTWNRISFRAKTLRAEQEYESINGRAKRKTPVKFWALVSDVNNIRFKEPEIVKPSIVR